MAELSFPMANLLNFPMDKLCYDLRLEILEQMDPKDILELMKNNKEFRVILIDRPWMIFGEHVHSIIFRSMHSVEIKKHRNSSIFIDLSCESVLLKRITSCVQLIRTDSKVESNTEKETALEVLANLASLGEVETMLDRSAMRKFFAIFKGKVTERIFLDLTRNIDNENRRYLTNLFESQLENCKEISMNGRGSEFYFLRQLLLKTNVEMIALNVAEEQHNNPKSADLIAGWIASRGIPSRNKYPAILLTFTPNNQLDNFLSATSGLQKIVGESPIRETRQLMDEIFKKYPFRRYQGLPVEFLGSYKLKIDDERDCIYIVWRVKKLCAPLDLFAKYVPAQQ